MKDIKFSQTEIDEIESKILELAKKYYPDTLNDWEARHRALAMFGGFLYFMENK